MACAVHRAAVGLNAAALTPTRHARRRAVLQCQKICAPIERPREIGAHASSHGERISIRMSPESEPNQAPDTDTPGEATSRWRVPPGLGAVVLLVAWALAVTTLIERRPYGLDEPTARAVLSLWSVVDEVASPVLALGVPDFRALYLIPAGVPFSGSLLAVKLCTLAVVVLAVIGLFRWKRTQGDVEAPLLASSLFLLSPLAITSIDRIAVGPFLLLTFVLGAWADASYRASRVRFGGMYFAQLLLCITAATLHPAGIALPVVLAAAWWRERESERAAATPVPGRERTHFLVGIGAATVLGVALAGGWRAQAWFANPVTTPVAAIFALHVATAAGAALVWLVGGALTLGLLLTLWRLRARLRDDRLLAMLALGALVALPTGDSTYCMLLFAVLLYWGFPMLLGVRLGGAAGGFLSQRGVGFIVLFALLTAFLAADRDRFEEVRDGAPLTAQDQLIESLASAVQQAHHGTAGATGPTAEVGGGAGARAPRVASQWPGRTMIACRCGALPLPPATTDPQALLDELRGVDFVVFDPKLPGNQPLARNFALLGGERVETISLQPGGVVLRLHPAPAGTPAPAHGGGAAQARG